MGIKYNIQFKGAREGNLKVVGCVKPVAAILRGTIVGVEGSPALINWQES
ncbi:hypothetical protein HMP0721_0349 [Pseudoramibacter alactolyticus ATCC 23263]|uniref:Uncharacterized protein n=1 Tax=Pseudoramibacter alactolyticus ATCC 23263 TaxID=887929 RepID=E6MEB6_9FIRM|nr:hypothetical protein [Pseudoramibacter alactolyticus]EFV02441.1 hypothetical protein HMP0721_0349 [Pseudoramibacter alactolyticus ATCC 23263]